jgi:hypothetical protein
MSKKTIMTESQFIKYLSESIINERRNQPITVNINGEVKKCFIENRLNEERGVPVFLEELTAQFIGKIIRLIKQETYIFNQTSDNGLKFMEIKNHKFNCFKNTFILKPKITLLIYKVDSSDDYDKYLDVTNNPYFNTDGEMKLSDDRNFYVF